MCRLGRIAAVSGKAAPNRRLLKQLLDSDFDPDQWDAHMAAAFDDEYYATAEAEADVHGAVDAELAAWETPEQEAAEPPEEAIDGGMSFAQVHARVTGSAKVHLPETDYAPAASAPSSDQRPVSAAGEAPSASSSSSESGDESDASEGSSDSESSQDGDDDGSGAHTEAEKQLRKDKVLHRQPCFRP